MNKSALLLGGIYLLVFGLFYCFTLSNLSNLTQKDSLFCIGISTLIALVGILILYARKSEVPQADAFRLLIMITVQLLSFMSVSLALIYTNQSETLVFHLLGLAMTLIVVQTVFIVRRLKSTDEF
jgi:hypothetical protein